MIPGHHHHTEHAEGYNHDEESDRQDDLQPGEGLELKEFKDPLLPAGPPQQMMVMTPSVAATQIAGTMPLTVAYFANQEQKRQENFNKKVNDCCAAFCACMDVICKDCVGPCLEAFCKCLIECIAELCKQELHHRIHHPNEPHDAHSHGLAEHRHR